MLSSCRNFDRFLVLEHTYTVTMQQGSDGYTGTTDAHLTEWAPDNNTGGNPFFEVCRVPQNNQNDDKYGLVRFDISSIPQDAEIVSAQLQLYFMDVRNGSSVKIVQCHRVTAFWDEGNEVGLDGLVGPGVTWNMRPAYDSTILSTITIGAITLDFHGFDITEAVRMWMDGSAENYGVLLKPEMADNYPQNAPGSKQFASSEHTTLSMRPRLTITYREYEYVE